MKSLHTFIIILIFLTNGISQSICDQFWTTTQQHNPTTAQKRSFRMTEQFKDASRINYTEGDTLGRIHFLGNVGSLKIESYFANGKRYSKVKSEYLQNDEWTWQEAQTENHNTHKLHEAWQKNTENVDCQVIGEEKIQSKACAILAYTLYTKVPKRNGIDSFLMTFNVKTWFCAKDNLPYKHTYEATTEKVGQTIKSTIEYDVPVKIDIPKKTTYEVPRQIMPTQNSVLESPKIEKTIELPIDIPQTVVIKKPTDSLQIAVVKKPEDSTKTVIQKTLIVPIEKRDTGIIYATVDQSPEYKEGTAALFKFVNTNMHYPEDARKEGLSGNVYVSFVVEIDGTISNIAVLKSIRNDVDAEAIRVVRAMSGAWKAGKHKGNAVRATYVLPFKFELGE